MSRFTTLPLIILLMTSTWCWNSTATAQQRSNYNPNRSATQSATQSSNSVRLSLSDRSASKASGSAVVLENNEAAELADTLVLCPAPFLTALQPWLEYRRGQGHRIHVLSPTNSAYGIKRQVREIAQHGNLKNLVLIGDAPNSNPNSIHYSIPTDYVPAKVVRKYGSEPEIATDNSYADIDGDGLPDLSLGRIPVDSPKSLTQQVQKIIAYEKAKSGEWQRQINLVAGTGGFGQLSDSVIERTSKRLISDLIPPEYNTSMTYASWSSAYCPDPREFASTTLDRLNEGCLFWVYMGHGHPHRLGYLRTPVGGFPILRREHMPNICCQNGNPIAVMLACYTGAFDLPKDCIAEQMMQQPCGPIAVLCGSRVTMPCGMSLLSVGLIEEYFGGDAETLGEILKRAKRKLVVKKQPDAKSKSVGKLVPQKIQKTALKDLAVKNTSPLAMPVEDTPNFQGKYRDMIRLLGEKLNPKGTSLEVESMEHVHLFHLLGDPLLRVKRPHQIQLEVVPNEDPSKVLVKGVSPHAGQMLVELAYSRDRFKKRPPRRPEFEYTVPALDKYKAIYEQSNKRTVSSKSIEVPAGEFHLELDVPEWAKGRCVVRGFLNEKNTGRYAMGASELKLKRR